MAGLCRACGQPWPASPPRRGIYGYRELPGLYAARKDAGMTQKELAEKAGTSFARISQIERGIQMVGYDLRRRLADALEVPLSEIEELAPDDEHLRHPDWRGREYVDAKYGTAEGSTQCS